MIQTSTISQLRDTIQQYKKLNNQIAFVPTMGNLHQGHLDLVEKAKTLADIAIVSIFVNPLQFPAGEDLDNYPRTLQQDIEKLEALEVDCLFVPDVAEIYGAGLEKTTKVIVPELGDLWCGASRSGHFDGVTTVVNKLFNLVQPDVAVFGEKDFQQLSIIKKMVKDLNMPVEIVGVATRREADGLAMSSRNGYLSAEEREIAPTLNRVIQQLANDIKTDRSSIQPSVDKAVASLNSSGFTTDYLAVVNRTTLLPAGQNDVDLVILAAAYLGKARLIDNLQFRLA